jgi:hypothetical protein
MNFMALAAGCRQGTEMPSREQGHGILSDESAQSEINRRFSIQK